MAKTIQSENHIKFIISAGFLSAVSIIILGRMLIRPAWFDEALTITEYLSLPSVAGIYKNYTIPNNHIVFTFFLRIWSDGFNSFFPFSVPQLRMFSLFISVFTVYLLFRFLSRRHGIISAFFVVFCFILSCPFALYGSAIRGYMLSLLFVTLGMESAMRYSETKSVRHALYYFLSAFFAVGIMPTNILPFAALNIILLPELKIKHLFSDRTIPLVVLPLFAFLLFYFPIWNKLIKALSLKEGWGGGPVTASLHLYGAFIISFLPVLIPSLFVFCGCLKNRFSAWHISSFVIVFALPLLIMPLKNPSPFPRAFFSLWPIWMYLLSDCCRVFSRKFFPIRFKTGAVLGTCFAFVIGWAFIQNSFSLKFSGFLTRGGQDDFFSPYFLQNFHPQETVSKALELTCCSQGREMVFIDVGADFPSIVFYGKCAGVDETFWLFDYPSRKVKSFGDKKEIYVISRNDGTMKSLQNRFNIASYSKVADFGYQSIYFARLPNMGQ